MVALCFVAFMLCNMDRVNMSIAVLPMAKQYAWDSATIGLVQSSFFWRAPATAGRPPQMQSCMTRPRECGSACTSLDNGVRESKCEKASSLNSFD